MARGYLIALSFANLCYLPIWKRLLGLRQATEFGMKNLPSRGEYAAAVCGVLLLAAVLVGLDAIFRRAPALLQGLELPLGLSLIAISVQSFLFGAVPWWHRLQPVHEEPRVMLVRFASSRPLLCIPAFILVFTAVSALLVRYRRPIQRRAALLLLAVLPVCAVTFGTSLFKASARTALSDPSPAKPLPYARGPRVLWIVFDEWDQRLTFDARPAGLALPAIDRLRGESLFATNALSPADATILSMPSLIEGRMVRGATPIDAQTMLLEYTDGAKQRFGDEPNLFSEVRRAGMNAAAYGWYLPYCRAFAEFLSDCWWQEMDAVWNSGGATFASALLTQPRALFETSLFSPFGQSLTVLKHRRTYEELLERSKRVAVDRTVQFALVHFNVPHPPYFYDRDSRQMTRANSPFAYPDALALVDRTIAELRADMERNSIILVLSSDHFYRSSPLTNGVRDRRVPFLVHFPGQSTALSYARPFNTVLTHDLILAMLHSEVTGAASTQDWLNHHNL
jgi:hypothetical protein